MGCGRRAGVLATTAGVHVTRGASGHPRDRGLWRDVTPALQTHADVMDALAGETLLYCSTNPA
jgi:hypothetical protein